MKRSLFVFLLLSLTLVLGIVVSPISAQDRPDLLIWADNTRTPPLTELAAQFSEEYGVTVSVQEVGFGDIRANLGIVGPTGQGPDIIVAAHDWIGELVLNGSVAPIDLGDKASEFSEAGLSLFTYNGALYGMPYAVENVAFFRNTDLVPEAPATWEEVRQISEELVESGDAGYGWIIQTNDPYHWFPQLSAFGGYFFGRSDDGNYNPQDVGVDNAGAIAAAEFLQGMASDGLVPTAVDYDVMHTLFETGEAAMIITGPWALPRIRESGVPYAISDIPAGPEGSPGRPLIGGQGFMLSAYSDNQLLAEAFLLDYMATDEAMSALYAVDTRPPAYLPLLESLDDPDMDAFQHAGIVGLPQPSIPEMSSVWTSVGNAQQFVIQGDIPAAEAMETAAAQIRELIAGGGVQAVIMSQAGDTPPEDGPQAVVIAGSLQAALGCAADWAPECEETALGYSADSDIWFATFVVPAGDYEYKVAFEGAWDENYGAGGERDGANIALSVAEEGPVTFFFDNKTHYVTDSVNAVVATVAGDFQSELGCSGDWLPECGRSWLQDIDGDGVYTFTTDAIPAGDYQGKVAINRTWDENYGENGERDGANIAFNVPAEGTPVTFSYDSSSHVLTVSAGS